MDSTASHASVAGLKRPAEDIPARLGSWELVERLGSGAQGAVFLGVSESGERAAISRRANTVRKLARDGQL